MTDKDEHRRALCDEMRAAGVTEAQITLALETSGCCWISWPAPG